MLEELTHLYQLRPYLSLGLAIQDPTLLSPKRRLTVVNSLILLNIIQNTKKLLLVGWQATQKSNFYATTEEMDFCAE